MSTAEADAESGVTMSDPALGVEVVTDQLDMPTSMAFIDDGTLVTEKSTGRVRVVRDGEIVGDAIDLAVNNFDERGLLGIAVHPEFPTEPYVYLHWTWRGEGDGAQGLLGEDSDEATAVPALGNRVDRFRWQDDELVFDLNIVEFPSNTLDTDTSGNVRGNHDAGPLAFGPDGMLYTMMGDQNLRGQLQNVADGPAPDDEHLAGVILRLNDDGSVPEDNPFFDVGADLGGDVGENIQKVYVYGVRNSFGMAFEPDSGVLWQTENGDDSWDEINVFEPGANSGWIQIQGPPERLDQYAEIEQGSDDGLDVASFPPSMIAADEESARSAMFSLPGSEFTAPVLSYVYPPALAAIGIVSDGQLGPASERTVWVGAVLNDSLFRYPLAEDGRSLTLRRRAGRWCGRQRIQGRPRGERAVGRRIRLRNRHRRTHPWRTSTMASYSRTVRLRTSAGLIAAVVLVLGAAGCGGDSDDGADGGSDSGGPADAVTVTVDDNFFEPEAVDVATGGTVTWEWVGSETHNVKHDDFESEFLTEGTFEHTFDEAGTYEYMCTVHPGMEGTVNVED